MGEGARPYPGNAPFLPSGLLSLCISVGLCLRIPISLTDFKTPIPPLLLLKKEGAEASRQWRYVVTPLLRRDERLSKGGPGSHNASLAVVRSGVGWS